MACWPDHFVCQDCLYDYLSSKITEGKVIDIKCPCSSNSDKNINLCENTFSEQTILQILSKKTSLSFLNEFFKHCYDVEKGIEPDHDIDYF